MAEAGAAAVGAAGDMGVRSPTFTRVWSEVLFGKGCAGAFCHGAAMGSLAMATPAQAYASLVGVAAAGPACSATGRMRVAPGDPDASLLLEKMSQATPSCGEVMPIATRFEPDCLSPSPAVCTTVDELELVRAWIAAGARDD